MSNSEVRTIYAERRQDLTVRPTPTALFKKELNIQTMSEEKKLIIKDNTYKRPFSWFLTHASGQMFHSGRITKKEDTIDIQDLQSGLYHFRAQGEVLEINVA